MSANNAIFINKKTLKVYLHECMDNIFKPSKENLIGKGGNLEEAIEIADKYDRDLWPASYIEYGIHFFE